MSLYKHQTAGTATTVGTQVVCWPQSRRVTKHWQAKRRPQNQRYCAEYMPINHKWSLYHYSKTKVSQNSKVLNSIWLEWLDPWPTCRNSRKDWQKNWWYRSIHITACDAYVVAAKWICTSFFGKERQRWSFAMDPNTVDTRVHFR